MTQFELNRSNSTTALEPIIVAQDVEKWYNNGFHALKGVSLTVNKGEVVVIMGPSGSGKSTFIRTFNALEPFQKGTITVDGIHLTHNLKNIDTIRSEVGMVFQQFNLFPHLTVMDNITLGLIYVRRWNQKNQPKLQLSFWNESVFSIKRKNILINYLEGNNNE